MTECISQVHDQLENNQGEHKRMKTMLNKEMKLLTQQNQDILKQTKQELSSMAMAQSCIAEFIQMQTAID